ncbi:YSIRK-type signal peptide-containing protein [Staphylococcus simulans]|nr:YSIRK-type signal peptide-containing protein [Staphylococcus simulans]UXV41189.1 YSIRK-type signal peptide-containing protein [Staphylococcus simulans]
MKQPNRRLDFLPNKQNKYSIRKFTVGTASILVGATLMFGLSHDAQAAEEQTSSTDTTQTQSESPNPNSDTTSQPTQETKTTAVVTPPVTTEAPASENTAPHNPELNQTTSEAPTTIEQAPQPEETNPTAKDTTPESTPTIDPTSESNPTIHTRAKRSLDTEPPVEQVEAPVNNETYNGKIIDYTGSDLVKKVANPGVETAPSEINFSPKFVDGRSKSYAFIVKKDKTVQKHLTTANGHGNIHAYFGDYITLNKDNSEAYVYFSSLGVADGHSVDALAHIVVNTAKSSDVNQTRYFLTSGTDLLSMVSLAGGGSTATLNFLKNTDQTVIDKLYNSVSTNDTITHVLDELNKIKGDAERVNGLFNIYDLDDYRTNLDTRKSVTFNRDQIEKLYVSSKERHVASSNLELKDGKVIISSGQHPYGEKYGFPNRVTVSYLNQSEITYSMTGQNASGPAFHPEGLLLVPIQPFSTKDNPNSKGDGAITLLQYLPDRKVTQPETLPTKLEIKAVFPDGVKASLTPTNYFTGLTQDKLNELTIVPGTNGVAKPEYFKQQAFYNKSYELPVSLEHQLTTEDIKNDSTKWQSLQKYYDADKGVIEVPVTWSFDNGVNKWEHLDTDNDMIALKVSDALKNEIDNKTKADATASIEEAKIADKEAKAKLQQAIGDSLVSETEYNNLTNAKTNGESKKNTAQEKVNMLPERLRTELQEELNKLDGINLPEINDRNNNNILDEQDKLIEEAKALLKEAKDAEDKAKTTLQQANVNDAISPEEHNNLSALQQDFTAKKKAAEAKIRAVHENHQSPLINQLNQLVGITVPEVNDNDNNGKPDTEDKKEQQASALKNAEDLVSKAEEADNTAQIQLQKANEDKLIKPQEHTDLTAAKENADTTKSTADTAVKALPQEMQDSLLERLEKLKGIQVPNINDRNNNNISDGQDALIVEAEASLKEAKDAEDKAKSTLEEANANNAITPEEHNNLASLQQEFEDKKQKAKEKIATIDVQYQTPLTEKLNQLVGIKVPDANDTNKNGKPDAEDAKEQQSIALRNATDLVEKAEASDQAAQTKLHQVKEDQLVKPEEHTHLTAAKEDAHSTKSTADAAVKALPQEIQTPLLERLAKLDGIEVPVINDHNNNNIPDEQDALIAEAQDLLAAVKAADQKANEELTKAEADKAINQQEHDNLENLQQDFTTKKQAASDKINQIEEKYRGDLPTQLEALKGITVPAVNDTNSNGKPDDQDAKEQQDAALKNAEDLVKKAEAADQAAQTQLQQANADNLIKAQEHQDLTVSKENADTIKTTADKAVKALPSEVQTPLLERLAKLKGITVPGINDNNENNIPDEQDALIEAAKLSIKAVEAADKLANEELVKANDDKVINQQEHDNLDELQQDFTTKKQAANDKINAIDVQYRGELPTQLAALNGIVVPEVNDKDNNGKTDDVDKAELEALLKEAQVSLDKAKAADLAAKHNLTDATQDKLINPKEHQDLTEAQKTAVSTKAEATEKVNALPEALRAPLEQELAKLDGIRVPDINDNNNNMIPDTQDALVKAAEAAIEKATVVDDLAKSELTKANENQAILPEEHQTLQNLQHDFEQKKATAQQALDAVDPAYQGVLPGKLKALTGIDVPEVNDANSNDVADDKEAELRKLVQKVIETDKAAKAAILAIQDDGLVNPDEIESLRSFKLAAYESKMNAFTDVHNLSEGTPLKAELLSVLRQYPDLIVPPVNDNNANDIPDSEDLLIRFAGDALKEAQAADTSTKEMLAEALKPNELIDETEHQALVAAQANFEQKKALANEKINAIQEAYRKDLPKQLAALTGITVPEVNDEDKNGIRDDVDQAIHKAKEAVEAAKAAYNNALTQMDDIQKDNITTPEESTDLAKAISLAEDKKAAAQTLVDALFSEHAKQTLQTELDELTPIGPPQVNDENQNGVPDKEDSLFDEAAKAYEAAKNAETVAQTALEEVQADGVVNPDEQAQLKALQEEFKQKKALAEEKLEAVESKYRQDLPEKVQALTGISIPSVNDKNQNGIRDDIDTLIDKAQQLINATKDMAQAAQAKADEALVDGLINPSELEVLSGAKNLVEANKAAAQAAIDALPMAYQKDLQLQLDAINEITLPTVNDQDNNHIDDHTDALKAAVQDLVDEAKRAHESSQQQLESIQQDQLVTPKEQSELINQVNYTKTAKHYAQKAVDMIDENLRPEFQPQLDALKAIDIPEVNDKNANGIDDNQDQLMSDALQAIKAAEAAEKVAKAGLETAQDNGVINDDEHDMLSNLQKAFLAQKNIAKDKIALVDDALKGELLKMLDALKGIAVPAVNDHNHNDVDDTLDQTLQDLINAVKAAHETAQGDLIKANADYLITPQEQDTLIESQNHASKLKEQATETIQQSKIPAAVKDELLNALAQMQAISIPDINDQNANGIADDIDTLLKQAEARVAQAEKMNQEVQSELDTANENGLITPQEHQNLSQHQALFEGAKDSAQQIVKQLPAAYQSPFEVRLKQLQGITVPNINDQNANNISDADDAALAEATEFVRVAQAMDAKLQEKLATNTADGLVTPSEYKQLAQLQAIYEDVKAQAKEKVNQLPLTLQGNLPKDLALLKGITLPQINDQNENGIDDNVDVLINEARDAVKVAQSADEHAQILFDSTVSDNLITPQEQTLLKSAQEEAQTLKTSAETKVNALPSELKGNLPALLAQLQGIDIPEINDANANGTNDIQDQWLNDAEAAVKAAELADKAAQSAWNMAVSDNLITPQEQTLLKSAQEEAQILKTSAERKVNVLPSELKGNLPALLAQLQGIDIPEINDANANGTNDIQDQWLNEAEAALKEAISTNNTAHIELEKVLSDHHVQTEEQEALTIVQEKVKTTKELAQSAIAQLPSELKGNLISELNNIENIEIPAVTEDKSTTSLETISNEVVSEKSVTTTTQQEEIHLENADEISLNQIVSETTSSVDLNTESEVKQEVKTEGTNKQLEHTTEEKASSESASIEVEHQTEITQKHQTSKDNNASDESTNEHQDTTRTSNGHIHQYDKESSSQTLSHTATRTTHPEQTVSSKQQKALPNTGQSQSNSILVGGLATLIGVAFLVSSRRRKN